MIPKVIHYCWFGGGKLPDDAMKCIESWKKYEPDYVIKRWDESNFDFNSCCYAKEAYEAKKWAFVSDFARFKILHDEGGLYFDTDVELIGSIDDILEKGSFMGCEKNSRGHESEIVPGLRIAVNPGLGLAADADNAFVDEILNYYEKIHYLNADGSYNQDTVVTIVTRLLYKYGYRGTGSIENVSGFNIYPSDYFCPIDVATDKITLTSNTRSIHHFSASWVDSRTQAKWKVYKNVNRIFGKKAADKVIAIYHKLKS